MTKMKGLNDYQVRERKTSRLPIYDKEGHNDQPRLNKGRLSDHQVTVRGNYITVKSHSKKE
jgi:hypothetical protein